MDRHTGPKPVSPLNPYQRGQQYYGSAPYGHGQDAEEEEEQNEYQVEIDALKGEIATLRGSMKNLNDQLYQERRKHLAEVEAIKSGATPASMTPGNGSFKATRHPLVPSPVIPKGSVQDDPSVLRSQVQMLQSSLLSMTNERDAAVAEATRIKADSQRWGMERAALQNQVDVLQRKVAQGVGGDEESELVAQLEEEKAALKSELDMFKQSLKDNVLVPKAHMERLPSLSSPGGEAGMTRSASQNLSRNSTMTGGGAMDQAATITRLNAEITRLQADLFIIKDTCVNVPKPEYAQLKGAHTEKAAIEQELKSVRQELVDVSRLNKMLKEEMEFIKEQHVPITLQEYEELRRAAAEKKTLEHQMAAQSKHSTVVPNYEYAELQNARRTLAGVEAKLSALQAAASVNADDTSRALQAATNDAADLRVKLTECEAQCRELRQLVESSQGQSQTISELQERARAAEVTLQVVTQEKSRLTMRIKSLEEEVESLKQLHKEAQAESARLAVELGGVRDEKSAMSQEVSQLTRERGELEAKLTNVEATQEHLTKELVQNKLDLAAFKELEVLYRKKMAELQKQVDSLVIS